VLAGAVGGLLAVGGVGLGASATAATPPEPAGLRAAAASSTVSPSGVAAPTASTKHWKRVVSEEFTRPAPLGRFAARYPGWAGYDGNRDTSRDTGRPVAQQGLWSSRTTMSVQDGVLDCRLHTSGVTPQICAVTPTATGEWWKGRKYGKYVVRFRADRTPGYKIAWLLWPESNIWGQGEIDFPEGDLAGTITGAAHRLGDPEWTPRYFDTRTAMTGWHTATIAWKPGRITFRLDDRTWTTTRRSVLPKVRMRWALQAETRITRRPPARATTGHIEIDWVAAYRWRG
jgi:hypothetical protein